MLPTEQLQQFLLRAVTGAGARVQAAEVTEKDLQETEGRLRMMAGYCVLLLLLKLLISAIVTVVSATAAVDVISICLAIVSLLMLNTLIATVSLHCALTRAVRADIPKEGGAADRRGGRTRPAWSL